MARNNETPDSRRPAWCRHRRLPDRPPDCRAEGRTVRSYRPPDRTDRRRLPRPEGNREVPVDRPVHRHHRYFERGHQLGHRHRAHRRHHRGPQVRACRHRIRCFRGHRQQGAAGQVRPGDLLRRRGQGRRHLLRGRCGWRDSVPAPAARVPGRRQGDQHARHRQRHHQLHSRRDDHQGSPVRRRAQGRPGQRATPKPTRPATSKATMLPTRPPSWPPSASTPP